MAKTPSKKNISASKNKAKAVVVKTPAKAPKAIKSSKQVAAAKMAPAPARKAVAVVTPAPATIAKVGKPIATTAKGAPKRAPVAKAIIPQPTAIMLIPRVPSAKGANGKPLATATASTAKAKVKPEKKHHVEPAYRPPLQESVPTDGKPRKNQAGLLSKELEHFRDLLLEKRREIVGDMSSMEGEALRSGGGGLSSLPVHMADMGTDNYEQEFTLGLVEKDRHLLREINTALAKIQNGTYGLCEGTGKPINKVRLEAQPWARFSIEWARQLERQRGLR